MLGSGRNILGIINFMYDQQVSMRRITYKNNKCSLSCALCSYPRNNVLMANQTKSTAKKHLYCQNNNVAYFAQVDLSGEKLNL